MQTLATAAGQVDVPADFPHMQRAQLGLPVLFVEQPVEAGPREGEGGIPAATAAPWLVAVQNQSWCSHSYAGGELAQASMHVYIAAVLRPSMFCG